MKLQPLTVIFTGLFLCSLGFNILLFVSNQKLVDERQEIENKNIQKMIEPKNEPNIQDKELNELLKKMIRNMLKEKIA